MWLEAGIAAAWDGGLHTGLRVAGAAKKIKKIFKKRYTFKKIKHIIYVSVEGRRFWFLNANENFGF